MMCMLAYFCTAKRACEEKREVSKIISQEKRIMESCSAESKECLWQRMNSKLQATLLEVTAAQC